MLQTALVLLTLDSKSIMWNVIRCNLYKIETCSSVGNKFSAKDFSHHAGKKEEEEIKCAYGRI